MIIHQLPPLTIMLLIHSAGYCWLLLVVSATNIGVAVTSQCQAADALAELSLWASRLVVVLAAGTWKCIPS